MRKIKILKCGDHFMCLVYPDNSKTDFVETQTLFYHITKQTPLLL